MKAIKWLDENIEEIILVVLCAIMACIMILQVIMRYVFRASLSWSEELTRFLFIWSSFLSISYCTRKRLNIQITMLLEALPVRIRYILMMIVDVIMVCLFAYLTPAAINYLGQTIANNQLSTALRLPMAVIYLAPVVGFILAIIRHLQSIAYDVSEMKKALAEEAAK